MSEFRKVLARAALAALAAVVAGSMLAATSSPASAFVVCDRYHCWHQHHRHAYYGAYYGPYYRDYYGPSYYESGYYGPNYYGPGISLSFGGGRGGGHGHHR